MWTSANTPSYFNIDGVGDYLMMNIPQLSYIAEDDMDEIVYQYLWVRMSDPDDHDLIDEITVEFKKSVAPSIGLEVTYVQQKKA